MNDHARAIALATDLIKSQEGCHLHAYPDPASALGRVLGHRGIVECGATGRIPPKLEGMPGDPWTIGWGAVNADVFRGACCTQARADEMLREEVQRVADRLRAIIKRDVTPFQLAALISFAYNVGLGNAEGSTLMRMVNQGHADLAAQQFERWKYAQGVALEGLAKRRAKEREMFERTA